VKLEPAERGGSTTTKPASTRTFLAIAGAAQIGLLAARSPGRPSTDPTRSAMARSEVVRRRRRRGASSNLSRTTSDFEIFRPRDSASMSATGRSGRRTVRVFMNLIVLRIWRVCKAEAAITQPLWGMGSKRFGGRAPSAEMTRTKDP